MIAFQIVLASIISTVLMTVFSYAISIIRGKQFREPVLLNKLLDRWVHMHITPHHSNPLGFLLHWFVGLLFVVVYHFIWVYTNIPVAWWSGALFGAVSGIVGIGIWTITFLIHPNPPKVHLWGFFAQLFFAHIIFGVGAWLGYVLPYYFD